MLLTVSCVCTGCTSPRSVSPGGTQAGRCEPSQGRGRASAVEPGRSEGFALEKHVSFPLACRWPRLTARGGSVQPPLGMGSTYFQQKHTLPKSLLEFSRNEWIWALASMCIFSALSVSVCPNAAHGGGGTSAALFPGTDWQKGLKIHGVCPRSVVRWVCWRESWGGTAWR